ncbi:5'-nucleotidase C-terminal domain-containing protein [Sporosarcina ureilytica]|uniref:Multifunctional 2',3'-cyclic-nucleotide 2'-phosphodiesterase/5'-nucleotidase/3'-nucleotidase n=1 Tax=Sporosarcina ureilytica TaxID=298596 RepID=A0A1D8JJ94_9BACL|nr:5'-nucleotidase C-terminal domain-containing protein [Sporosarcina ureilytica]AOV08775.1 multifunctional 2',3'-cyclic-nucleotide 2'-phosphodiesterase/5'-nucleotidase/3'-nucleotidase [Sporosarcina ureilytica]
MRNTFFKGIAVAILLFSAVTFNPVMAATGTATDDFTLTILHTNDTHSHLKTTAKRAALVKKLREENPVNLLLDAGDVFSGTLYFNEFQGQASLAVMNYLQYDAMIFGNHEFDLGGSDNGHQALSEFVTGAEFPFLATNVDFSKDDHFDGLQSKTITDEPENGHIYNGIIKEINGEQVGIFGLTTEETADISSPGNITFTNYIEEAQEAVAAFTEAGVNKIIAITHIGFDDSDLVDNDILLAKGVPGIDIIVGGHTHTKLDEPYVVNGDTEPVLIVQTEEYNKFLGQLDVTFDKDGVITDYNGVLHTVNREDAEIDEEAAELIKEYTDQVTETEKRPTGATAGVFLSGLRDFGGVRAGETNLGNVITDGMLKKAQEINPDTVIAFQNGGGIRESIPTGPITYGEAISVLPFGNTLALMELSGEELKAVFEHSVKDYPAESGGFLHVSGMQLVFDGEAEPGNRVLSMIVNEKEIEMDKMYTITTNVFTAKGGDGYTMLEEAYKEGRGSEPGFSDWENFVDHMKSLETITTGIEGRILAKVPFDDLSYNDWAYPYISDLYYRDMVNGTSEATYSPHRNLTRAQAASLIVRALDLKAEHEAPFDDLNGWAVETQEEIAAAYENGIVIGRDGSFAPGENVSRAQLALMIKRAFEVHTGKEYIANVTAPYTDYGRYDDEAINAISMLYELGIATGSQGKYMPNHSATRQQAVKIVSNFIYNTKQVESAAVNK